MQSLAAEVRKVRSKQGKHCLHWRIVQALLHLRCQPAHRETDTHAAHGHKKKLQACMPQRKAPRHYGGNSETKGDKGGRVVDQAFTFQNHNDFARHPQILRE